MCGQPIGWTPPVDDGDFYEVYQHGPPFSPSSSFSPLSDLDANPSHSGSNSPRRHHEPGWVARPRNAFIIFRCEYSQTHSRRGRRIRRPPGSSTEPTLSKRAAIAWSQMTREEKEPYKIRAEEERNEHARKYPDYRFRPQRRPGVGGRRYNTCHSISSVAGSYLSPENTPEPRRASVSSGSPVSASSRPSTSDGFSDLDFERRGSTSGWTLPLAYNAPSVPSISNKPSLEILPAPYIAGQLNGLPTPSSPDQKVDIPDDITIHKPSHIIPSPPSLLSWSGEPPASVAITDADAFGPVSAYTRMEITNLPNSFVATDGQDACSQYPTVEGIWSSHLVLQYPSVSGQIVDTIGPCVSNTSLPVISDYTTLGGAKLCVAGGTTVGGYFGAF